MLIPWRVSINLLFTTFLLAETTIRSPKSILKPQNPWNGSTEKNCKILPWKLTWQWKIAMFQIIPLKKLTWKGNITTFTYCWIGATSSNSCFFQCHVTLLAKKSHLRHISFGTSFLSRWFFPKFPPLNMAWYAMVLCLPSLASQLGSASRMETVAPLPECSSLWRQAP